MGNGDTWYRVMVGPFDSANAAHRAQDKLASAGIETLAIRAKTD
jgi:cell division protein FtsN